MLIEAGVVILFIGLFVIMGLVLWRSLRGPAISRPAQLGRILVMVLVAVPLAVGLTWQLTQSRSVQVFGEMINQVETSQPVIALTFDDGPSAEHTAEVLSTLDDVDVKATFFFTGRDLVQNIEQAQAVVLAGHELGNHSFSHQRMIGRPLDFIADEITKTEALIQAAGYEGEIHFRPPYGKRFLLLPWYLAQTGRKTIMWNIEPESYPDIAADADRITEHVLAEVHPGSIVLLHVMYDSRETSREALPQIVKGLRDRGYQFATISELMALSE